MPITEKIQAGPEAIARFREIQMQRRSVLLTVDSTIQGAIDLLKAPNGRPESAELTLAMRHLEDARFRVGQHLTIMDSEARKSEGDVSGQ